MLRRDVIRNVSIGSLAAVATTTLAPMVAAADTTGQPDSEAATALGELQQALDKLEAAFPAPPWNLRTASDLAEARRMLMHVLLHALQVMLEADPARPFFTSFINQHKKMLGDNADARYFHTVISDEHSYRIRGNLAGATYTSFTVELGSATDNTGVGPTLNDSQFSADADGNYEIIISREKHDGNWLPLPEGAASLVSRHYYERELSINNDRMHHIPLDIENQSPQPPRPVADDAALAAGIRRVTSFVTGSAVPFAADNSPAWVSRVPNVLPQPVADGSNKNQAYAAVDNVYSMAPFVLAPNQALVMRGRFPSCRFANVSLWNRFMQTFDYETRTVSLNRAQTVQDEQGNFEMIIAHRDPGRPNWLDTEGRPFGLIFWRFQLPEEDIDALETEVITLPG